MKDMGACKQSHSSSYAVLITTAATIFDRHPSIILLNVPTNHFPEHADPAVLVLFKWFPQSFSHDIPKYSLNTGFLDKADITIFR
jgi:hypothetical protein